MRGLVEKDLRILGQKKKYFLIFAGVAVVLSFSMDDSFIVSYITMIGMILSLTTISYDESDNGLPFLMTLPVSRRDYAVEKHIFGYIVITCAWIIGMIMNVAACMIQGKNFDIMALIPVSLLYLSVFAVILAILIPIELHFGMEKSRIAMFLVFGICFAIGLLGSKIASFLNIDLTPAVETIRSMPKGRLIAGGAGAVLVIIALSVMITIKIMNNKEF